MRKHLFDLAAAKYVSDTLAADQSWYPNDSKPVGTAFLAMHEGERIYHQLSEKCRRVVPEGFHATWSPEGTEFAYAFGTLGLSGIAIFNLESMKTRLLTVPGKDANCSPDGEYISYVRDRRVLPLSHLTTSREGRYQGGEEIWIVMVEGSRIEELDEKRQVSKDITEATKAFWLVEDSDFCYQG